MTDFSCNGFGTIFDATTSATPLAALKAGEAVNLKAMFLGNTAGTIGETSALLLLLGGVYLIANNIISWRIPVCYIVTLGVFVLLFGGHGFDVMYLAEQLCGGGLMLGAFFMATDYVTSPITPKGQIVFGILLGILTGIFRLFGASSEGVSYAIIFCNLLVPLIEKFTTPVAFGKGGKK
jgi:electron transport complex protein RnfD